MEKKQLRRDFMRSILSKKGMEVFPGTLTEREKIVLDKRVLKDETLNSVGSGLGITRERVRQVEQEIFNKMMQYRAAMECKESIGEDPIEFIEIPRTVKNRLYNRGITTASQIREMGIIALQKFPGIGQKTVLALQQALGA